MSKNQIYWPGWITRGRICGQGSGSLWELQRENSSELVTVKYVAVPRNTWETKNLLLQGKSREQVAAYFERLCRSAEEEYSVSLKLKDCRYVAVYRDIRKEQAEDGLGWNILLMMDALKPLDRCDEAAEKFRICKMGRQICTALEDSCRYGVLHGCITPRCIFADHGGDYQLGGFAGEYFGDLGDFRAPEAVQNYDCDIRADIYSLGMVMYWLLNDRQLPGRNRSKPKNGSEKLKAVVMKAISPNAADRYQTPRELREALGKLGIASPIGKLTGETGKKTDGAGKDTERRGAGGNQNLRKSVGIAAAAVLVLLLTVLLLGKPEGKKELCTEGHSWEAATCTNPKTCKVCGETQGIAADHSWEAATCTAPETCKVCGETQGIAAEHSWQAASCIAPKTCIVCGKTEGILKEHDWIAATYSSPKTCRACGQTEGSALRSEDNTKPYHMLMEDVVAGFYYAEWVIAPVFDSEYQRNQIRTVTFVASLDNANASSWDVSWNMDGTVLAWVEPNGSLYDLYIGAEGGVLAPENCRKMFAGYENLVSIQFNGAFDTSNVTSMRGLFEKCQSLRELDVSGFDTSRVTNMRAMFCNCSSLRKLDLSGFDTSNVVDMDGMFYCCSSLRRLDISSFDTSNVEIMKKMFCNCWNLSDLDLSHFDVSKVVDYEEFMNSGCTINGRPWEEFFRK